MQTWQIEEGQSFTWKGDSYVVLRHEEDITIVIRTMSGDRVISDEHRFEENFNPYCVVSKVLA